MMLSLQDSLYAVLQIYYGEACAAGALCTDDVLESAQHPDYAPCFHLAKYEDEKMIAEMAALSSDEQL